MAGAVELMGQRGERPMEWMIMPLKRYADFSGRSRRKEYWMFFLFSILIGIGFAILSAKFGSSTA